MIFILDLSLLIYSLHPQGPKHYRGGERIEGKEDVTNQQYSKHIMISETNRSEVSAKMVV